VRRDHIVSVRLTGAELATLRELGAPSDVLRDLLKDRIRGNQTVVRNPPTTVYPTTFVVPTHVSWFDGTAGAQWPQPVTA